MRLLLAGNENSLAAESSSFVAIGTEVAQPATTNMSSRSGEYRSRPRRDHRLIAGGARRRQAGLPLVGKGKYDPRFNIDGKSTPLVIPPAYGLRNVAKETY